jgi:hypothetical protein
MNTTRCVLILLLAAIAARGSSAHAATVVAHWSSPGYGITTVRTTGAYWGPRPVSCCYTSAVVAGAAVTATTITATTPPRPAPVIYASPVVTVYPAPVVYAPGTYYYVP